VSDCSRRAKVGVRPSWPVADVVEDRHGHLFTASALRNVINLIGFCVGASAPDLRTGMMLHKLRHSHACHMLASNVHPKIVQERPGHWSIEAAATVDGVVRVAINRRACDAEDVG
jgi:integrase